MSGIDVLLAARYAASIAKQGALHRTKVIEMTVSDELSLLAASEWAKANSATGIGPVEFGNRVAQVYLACHKTWANQGDEKATAASLAALSVRPEVLQAIAQLSSLTLRREAGDLSQTPLAGAEASV